MEKSFIITVDTEGDNLWLPYQTGSGHRNITTENAKYLVRFQELCEEYGFKPTYLTNYEMAIDENFINLGKKGLLDGKLEIGMHMHAWNSPPIYDLPFNPYGHNAYAGEYPNDILEEKMTVLTELLTERFETEIVSHRGGRWFLDDKVLQILVKLGYKSDCSVTPSVSWDNAIGNRITGNDYQKFPRGVFDLSIFFDIPPKELIEIPMTITDAPPFSLRIPSGLKDLKSMFDNKKIWLRPNGYNLYNMIWIVRNCDFEYLEFMIHSSELMPGGSPNFKTKKSIENLYNHIILLFKELVNQGWQGKTLKEYSLSYKMRYSDEYIK